MNKISTEAIYICKTYCYRTTIDIFPFEIKKKKKPPKSDQNL